MMPRGVKRCLANAGVEAKNEWGLGRLHLELFETRVEDQIEQPTFIMQHLSRCRRWQGATITRQS